MHESSSGLKRRIDTAADNGGDLIDLVRNLQWWADCFNTALFKEQPAPVAGIFFYKMKVTTFAQVLVERDGIELKEKIIINSVHLNRPMWHILTTLLHEMVHIWQACYGKPSGSWFHNREFQNKMLEFGIVCNCKGRHLGLSDPFVFLLRKHGLCLELKKGAGEVFEIPWSPKPTGKSKLKKWSCHCTNVRVAVKEFEAKCLRCGNRFELV
ncbi:hypothetical protein D1BOALGB6SA_6932 [Olavius sp. associated proteobacterium Delta 1]|nr:hypothetical protein D1BOALGB6SA_6932 [Olavius sp. associated proteobacterium Delta 1]